jgi:enoyl-CoA hydratase/carnithine racemase
MTDFSLQIDNPMSGVRRVCWLRAGKLNAFTSPMYQAIFDAVVDAEQDASVRVLWLTGGGGAFSAGNDLAEFESKGVTFPDAPVYRLLTAVSTFSKPLVMTPAGAAVGIGTTLCLHADFVCCQSDVRFQMPFVPLGLCPEGGSSLLIPQLVGHAKAMSWLLLGTPILAAEALQCGLVSSVSETAEALEAHTLALVQKLAALPMAAVAASKRLIKEHSRDGMQAVLATEGQQFSQLVELAEAREALAAFREKRKPRFN